MNKTFEATEQIQSYHPATISETRRLFTTLTRDRTNHQLQYRKRFVQGSNPKRPSNLRFSSTQFQTDKTLPLRKIFHEGLLKNADDSFWIIKSQNARARYDLEPREARNSSRHERLAYLLARGRANYTEIRQLPQSTQYLTRVVTSSNQDAASLSQRNPSDAYAAILVANIFMRKWDQHLNNFAFVGEIPVCIDHDVMGPASIFPCTPAGRSAYNLVFLSFKLVSLLPSLSPRHEVDERAKERLKYHFTQQNDREAWWIMRDLIHGLGMGAGLIQAEGLQASSLRKSILAFKSLRSIDQCAKDAGFQGKELSALTAYLQNNQATLGQDVGEIWRLLTGDNARLDRLD